MLRFFQALLMIGLVLFNIPTASAKQQNNIIGHVVNTDIVAFIDMMPIKSYNYNNNTYIIAEDLNNYGFDVSYDNTTRELHVMRNREKPFGFMPLEEVNIEINEETKARIGTIAFDIFTTDIITYLDGEFVNSYNINGQTIIAMDDFQKYGELKWNDKQRGFTDGMGFDFIEMGRTLLLNMLYKDIKDKYNSIPSEELLESTEDDEGRNLKYKGQMKGGKKSGIGFEIELIKASGSGPHCEYIGEFVNGIRCGKGIYYMYHTLGYNSSKRGKYYIGGFKDGEYDGFGVIHETYSPLAKAKRIEGYFKKGVPVAHSRSGFIGYNNQYKYGYVLTDEIVY